MLKNSDVRSRVLLLLIMEKSKNKNE